MFNTAKVLYSGHFTTDDSLPKGSGIKDNNGVYTCVHAINSEQIEFCTLDTTANTSEPVVSIGNGYFGIGNRLFEFGMEQPVCELEANIINSKKQFIRSIDACTFAHIIVKDSDFVEDSQISLTNDSSISSYLPTDKWEYWEDDFDYNTSSNGFISSVKIVVQTYYLDKSTKLLSLIDDQTYDLTSHFVDHYYIYDIIVFKDYLILSSGSPAYLFDWRTGKILDRILVPCNNEVSSVLRYDARENRLGLYQGNVHYRSHIEDYEYEPVTKLVRIIDVVDGKFVLSALDNSTRKQIVKTTFKASDHDLTHLDSFFCKKDILIINSNTLFNLFSSISPEPASMVFAIKDEALIYTPTCTIIPTIGYRSNKRIEIKSTLVSEDGQFLAILTDSYWRDNNNVLQISVIQTATGKTEQFVVSEQFDMNEYEDTKPRITLEYFSSNNSALVYSLRTITGSVLISQPIFNSRLRAESVILYNLMFQQLPLEVVYQITEFMEPFRLNHYYKELL